MRQSILIERPFTPVDRDSCAVPRHRKRWNRERVREAFYTALWNLEWAATVLTVWLIIGALLALFVLAMVGDSLPLGQ